MVRMAMGVENGIQVVYLMAEGLLSKIGGGIYQDLAIMPFQKQ